MLSGQCLLDFIQILSFEAIKLHMWVRGRFRTERYLNDAITQHETGNNKKSMATLARSVFSFSEGIERQAPMKACLVI